MLRPAVSSSGWLDCVPRRRTAHASTPARSAPGNPDACAAGTRHIADNPGHRGRNRTTRRPPASSEPSHAGFAATTDGGARLAVPGVPPIRAGVPSGRAGVPPGRVGVPQTRSRVPSERAGTPRRQTGTPPARSVRAGTPPSRLAHPCQLCAPSPPALPPGPRGFRPLSICRRLRCPGHPNSSARQGARSLPCLRMRCPRHLRLTFGEEFIPFFLYILFRSGGEETARREDTRRLLR